MPEISEEQSSDGLDLKQLLSFVRRRHIHFLIPLFVGFLLVWGASWFLPVRYKSSTLILVEQPTMPKNYVEPNVSDDLQERLQSITQQILSRTRLLIIIDKLHLYSGGKRPLTPDEKVGLMRRDTFIELVHDANGDQITAFKIYFSSQDPRAAQQVTGELKDLFISENNKARQQESEDTTKFIESQLENARTSLAAQEAKVRQFEGQHEGDLPTQQASNLQILSGLQSQLQNEQDALNTARQQRVYFQAQLDQSRSTHGVISASGVVVEATPTALIDQQIDTLRAKLADLHSRFTDRYPDVQAAEAQLASAEQQRLKIIADARKTGDASKRSGKSADGTAVADSAPSLPVLQQQGQLQANEMEIKNREQSIAELKARIGDYQARLNLEPSTEQQLADLTRGYDQSKANYDDLLKKKTESSMATDMEQMQQGERFTMLDPPTLPVKPDFPNHLKFCGIAVGFGIALGVVVVGGFEFLDERIHSEKRIKSLLPVAIICEIPEVVSPFDEQNRRKRTALGWSMAVVVIFTILVGSAYSYLRG
jgi:polysaccharide chain length determinant protein (PEP-CTERM system associated)